MMAADLTDDQVRELRELLYRAYWSGDHSVWDAINLCRIALTSSDQIQRVSARTRCAAMITARTAKDKTP